MNESIYMRLTGKTPTGAVSNQLKRGQLHHHRHRPEYFLQYASLCLLLDSNSIQVKAAERRLGEAHMELVVQ